MANYDLAHLVQAEDQSEIGPIQDDEALFLYALVRGKRMTRILEVGGLNGYSATNFLKAMRGEGVLFTVDLSPVPSLADNHVIVQKDVSQLTADELGHEPLDLVFFDCHDYDAQMSCFMRLREQGNVNDETVLAFHDTNLHPRQYLGWAYPVEDGWVHQTTERRMVNDFHRMGYDALMIHTRVAQHTDAFPMRHGLTIMQKFRQLAL